MSTPVLALQNVSLQSGSVRRLQQLDLHVHSGEIVALLGPNGAGKSSLLGVMDGSLAVSSGQVSYPAWPVAPDALWQARHRAVLPQQSSLNFAFRAHEVVAMARTPHSGGRVEDEQIVSEVLAALDIAALAEQDYSCLSGGERQRVQLARVLAQIWQPTQDACPRLLLLDEPTSALDLAHQQQLMRLLSQRCDDNLAVVMVLHDVNLAAAWADRLLCLKQGRLVCSGSAEQVITQDNIRRVFDCDSVVLKHPSTGKPALLHA